MVSGMLISVLGQIQSTAAQLLPSGSSTLSLQAVTGMRVPPRPGFYVLRICDGSRALVTPVIIR